MNKFLIPCVSFVAGVLVTTLFFQVRGGGGTGDGGSSDSDTRLGASAVSPISNRQGTTSEQDVDESHQDRSVEFGPTLANNSLDDAAYNLKESTGQAGLDGSPKGADRTGASMASRNKQNGGQDSVPVAEEIAPFFEGDSKAAGFHDRMGDQDRNDSWATYMEGQIAGYLASKPSLAAFQIPLVQCRSSMCEIQAVGYGPESAATWFAAVVDMPDQPWAIEFNNGTGNFQMGEFGPDIVSILIQFAREAPDSTLNAVGTLASQNQ